MTIQDLHPARKEILPYSDSFRWLDRFGFEHLTNIRAENFDELAVYIGDAIASITDAQGQPLISSNLRITNEPLPSANAVETTQVQAREGGVPVVDPNGQPVMEKLPEGHHLFTVKEVFKDTPAKGGDPKFKVVIEEQGYEWANSKWGITCFHPPVDFNGWKNWDAGQRFRPHPNAAKVVIRDPKPGGRFADVVEFRPA